MSRLLLAAVLVATLGCSGDVKSINGKWATYSEGGDYNELWIQDDRALSYLSRLDEFLLYEVKQQGNQYDFNLLESKLVQDHQFSLEVLEQNEKWVKTIFISSNRVDSLKTFFSVSEKLPEIGADINANQIYREEIIDRMNGESHE